MQGLPQASAQGTLGKTPLPQLLVYVLERQLHGTLQLKAPSGAHATLFVVRGFPAKVRLSDPVARLDEVLALCELAKDDDITRAGTRFEELAAAGTPKLFGQILLELGALDEATLRVALGRQIAQKIEHLFNWPPETTFAYYDGVDGLGDFGPAPVTMIDPLPLVWAAVKEFPSWSHVNVALTKLGAHPVRLSAHAVIDRLELAPAEAGLAGELRTRTMRLGDLTMNAHVTPSVAQLLLYCLLITKQLEVVMAEEEEVPSPAPSSNMMPQAPPSETRGAVSSTGSMPGGMTPIPSTQNSPGTQVARVQLAKSRSSSALPMAAVEERAPIVRIDGRIATPMPGKFGAVSSEANPLVPAFTASVATPSAPPPPLLTKETPTTPLQPASLTPLTPPSPISSSPSSPSSPRSAPQVSSVHSTPPPPLSSPSPLSSPLSSSARLSSPPVSPSSPPSSGSSGVPSRPALTAEQNMVRQRIIDRAAAIGGQSYFDILGVGHMATTEEIQQAFVALAKTWHPDRLPAILSDVRSECSKVFSHIGEAHATLIDPKRRAEYMQLMREGGATPDDQEKVQVLLAAATDFQKGEHFLKRGDNAKAEELVRKALKADPDQPEYLAAVAWLEAMKPENHDPEETMKRIAMLTEALRKNPKFEKAVYYRAMLYKRIGKDREAMNDFRTSVDLNPRNIDSAREIRLYNMRRQSNAPGARSSTKPPAPGASQLFGKLFKK